MEKSVIIVAGGSGKRMGTEIPKQFLSVAGKPILMHTIEVFYTYDTQLEIVVVLPEDQHEYWKKLQDKHNFSVAHKVVAGGKERFYSVQNGLSIIENNGLVAIHDGVRPLVSIKTIEACFKTCEQKKAVIPVIAANESIRKIENNQSKAVNRSLYFMVQTPQVFNADILKKAYEQEVSPEFTDDASVVEKLGYEIAIVEGNVENIKITRPMDLKIAEVLLSK